MSRTAAPPPCAAAGIRANGSSIPPAANLKAARLDTFTARILHAAGIHGRASAAHCYAMPWTALRRDPLARVAGDQRRALRRLLSQVRYELIPLKDAQVRADLLPAHASVSVTASPAHGMEATLALAEWLQVRAHRAMPHLSA